MKQALKSYFWIQCIIWLLAACSMIFVFYKKLTPIYADETLSASNYITTEELKPGDFVIQTFTSTYNHLENVDIALSYADTIADDTAVLFQVYHGTELIIEQPLAVKSCPNVSFLTLYTNVSDCKGDTFTIRVENISENDDNTSFSLMATDKEYLYLDNTSNYQFDDQPETARIFCRFTYQTGWTYYPALTYAFWVFLVSLIVTGIVPGLYSKLLQNNNPSPDLESLKIPS